MNYSIGTARAPQPTNRPDPTKHQSALERANRCTFGAALAPILIVPLLVNIDQYCA